MKEYFRKKRVWMIVLVSFLVVITVLLLLLYTLPLKNKVSSFDYTQHQYKESDNLIYLWTDCDIEQDYLNCINMERYVDFGSKPIEIKNNGSYTFEVLNDNTLYSKKFKIVVRKQANISAPYINYIMPRQFKYGTDVSQMFRGVKFSAKNNKIVAKHKLCKKIVTYYVNDFVDNYVQCQDNVKQIIFNCEQLYVVTIPLEWNVNIEMV